MDSSDISESVLRLPYIDGGRDAQRNPIDTWGLPETVGITAINPGGSRDHQRADHDRVITTPTIYAPPGTPFTHRDLCIARGIVYEIDGNPDQWIDEYGTPEGDVITLRKVDG